METNGMKMEITFNKSFDGYKEGDKIKVILNGYWRNRLKDKDISLVDNSEKEEKESKKTKSKKD